jgi:3-methyladenine DNA glycosylase AlkD
VGRFVSAGSTWADDALRSMVASLAAAGDAERAASMRKYMRDQFAFFGVPTPERRRITRRVLAALDEPRSPDVETFAVLAWEREERELQYVAVDVLAAHAGRARPELLVTVRRLITTKSWWDTVDALASKVVGPLARRHPELVGTLDDWIVGRDLWLARTAMLHQLAYKEHTDVDRLFRYSLALAGREDFFARKAIGWALRQYAVTDPRAVERFLSDHAADLSPLTRREAAKHL